MAVLGGFQVRSGALIFLFADIERSSRPRQADIEAMETSPSSRRLDERAESIACAWRAPRSVV